MSKFRNKIITLFKRKMLQNTKFVLMYPQGAVPSLPTPSPPSSKPVTAGRNQVNYPPPPPLGQTSDKAIPYQFRVKQRSGADVNSPYKRKC